MKIKIEQSVLNNALKLVGKAVAKKEVYPVATGILFEAKNGELNLFATDFVCGIEKKVTNCDIIEEGSTVIKGDILQRYVNKLKNEEITLTSNDRFKTVVKSSTGKVTIEGYDPEQFPGKEKFDSVNSVSLLQKDLKYLFDKTKFAAKQDVESTNPALSGVKLESNNGKLTAVSTNVYRLSMSEKPVDSDVSNIDVILPLTATDVLSSLLRDGDIDVYFKTSWVRFDFGNTQVYSRVIDGKFPNYRQVLPTDKSFEVKLDKQQLINALERMMIITRTNTGETVVKVTVDDGGTYITSPENEDNIERLESELEGDVFETKLDAIYMLDFLKTLDKSVVTISGLGNEQPFIFKEIDNDQLLYLVMPVR